MPDLPDLDTRIRELVARAVADAPAAPELGSADLITAEPPADRRRWWIGGSAAVLAAAAATVVTLMVVGDDQQSVSTPATVPVTQAPATTAPPAVPTTTSPQARTVTVTTLNGPTTPEPGATAPGVPVQPAATTTSTTVAPEDVAAVALVTAGPDGIAVIEDGVEVRRLDRPAEIALLTPGGAVIFQPARASAEADPGPPEMWRPDGTVEPFLGPLPSGQWYRLHDVASVGGVPTVLYGVRTDGPAPEAYTEVVRALALDPAGWKTFDIAEVNTWEGGFSRLSLSHGGTIIGTRGESLSSNFFGAVVPGSPDDDGVTDPSDPSSLGVESSYVDCECPGDFAISADGTSIAWTIGQQLVVHDTATGEQRSWTVPALADQPVRSIDVRTSSDGGVEAAISFGRPTDDAVQPPVVAATSPPGEVVETPVGGRVAAFGP